MGHPVFELGSMFNAFVGYSELDHQNMMDFFGYSFETAVKFWNLALKMYLGTDDEKVCRDVAEKAMIVGYTRMLRRAIRRPGEPDSTAKIARCKEMLGVLLDKVDTLSFEIKGYKSPRFSFTKFFVNVISASGNFKFLYIDFEKTR
jgi:hypothetical protein